VRTYGELVEPAERRAIDDAVAALSFAELEKYEHDGIAVGEHAKAGALRFYARATLDGEPHGEAVLRRYLRAAMLAAAVARRLLDEQPWRAVVAQHGIYVPQGLLGEAARRAGVRVVNWNVAYRKRRFIFSHGDTYHRTMLAEPEASWASLQLSPALDRALSAYLRSRWHGGRDWIWFHERPVEDPDVIARALGIDFSRPCVGMLTNVAWDAQIHYPANAFPSMLDWDVQTIAYFARRPELQLVIRVHPAEIRGTLRSRQPVVAEIRRVFPVLPPNVVVVPPDLDISTYAVMTRCDAVLIFGTKTGVELAAEGIPVIVAGEAWIRGKGISMDASSVEEYVRLLDRLPLGRRLPEATVRRARTYAYHFFFRRMIPLEFMEPAGGWLPYRLALERLADCLPGQSAGLDVVCDGILHGTEFVYPQERGLPEGE
jgi:hypothetical protein